MTTHDDTARNAALVAENAWLREKLARVEALSIEWGRTADECERLAAHALGVDAPRLDTAGKVNRSRAANIRDALRPDQTPAQSNAAVSRFYAANPRVDAGPDVRADLQRSFGELA